MAIVETLQEIKNSVNDIIKLGFEITRAQGHYVPGYEDSSLSFESGKNKKAKTINTCVLYADIRDSTTLSHSHSHETMSRLYTAFVKSMLMIADEHNGVVRNIIGDRVMIVFPQDNCFQNALNAAVSIYTVATEIIDKQFTGLSFKCGIGIDYGEMTIIKAGLPKREPERTNYKNLIWIGKPANIASKLTDVAHKTIKKTFFKVSYNGYNFFGIHFPVFNIQGLPIASPASQSIYNSSISVDEIDELEFVKNITWDKSLGFSYAKGKFISFEKIERDYVEAPILFSEAVYSGFVSAYPNDPTIKQGFWRKQQVALKDYTGQVYGGTVFWQVSGKLH